MLLCSVRIADVAFSLRELPFSGHVSDHSQRLSGPGHDVRDRGGGHDGDILQRAC